MSEKDGLNFIIAQELSPQTEEQTAQLHAVREFVNTIAPEVKRQAAEAQPLPTELNAFVIAEKERQTRELIQHDVNPDNIHWSNIYYDKPGSNLVGSHGKSGLGYVGIPNFPIYLPHVKLYQEAVVAAHELYHDVSPIKLGLGKKDIKIERKGVDYNSSGNEENALEEGLAIRSQLESEKLARQMFPKGAEDFDFAKDNFVKKGRLDPNREELIVTSWNLDGDIECTKQSLECFKLVNYLMAEIPDFLGLVDRARVDHKTIELAKEIESRFGRGSYRKIVTTSRKDADAVRLIEELKNEKP